MKSIKSIKSIINSTTHNLINFIKKFPITLIIIMLTTLFLVISIDLEYIKGPTIQKILKFSTIFVIEILFIETYFNNKIYKVVFDIISAIISIIFVLLLNIEDGFLLQYKDIIVNNINLVLIWYLITLVILILYKFIKISNLSLSEYLIITFGNIFSSTLVYFILNIGLTIISGIFILLILDNNDFIILIKLQVALLGLFYVPAIINSFFITNKKDVNFFIKSIICYILLPLICIAILIIYIYMAKIFILKDIPSNVIYRILAGIFVTGIPVIYMASNYRKKNKFLKYTLKTLPYLFIPFVFLQLYSVIQRYIDKGITPLRYISYMFLIFEIIILTLTIFRINKKLKLLLISSITIITITFISPLNLVSVSNMNQSYILKRAFYNETEFNNLNIKNKEKVNSAYKYLKKQYNSEKYIPNYIARNDKEILDYSTNSANINKESEIRSINIKIPESTINIVDYSKITKVRVYESKKVDLNNIEIKDYSNKIIENIDLSNIVNDIINKNLNESKIQSQNPLILNNNKSLYILSLLIQYSSSDNEIINITLDGYLLEK